MDILAGSDTSTTLLKFLHLAHLSTAGAEWSESQIQQLEYALAGPFRPPQQHTQPTAANQIKVIYDRCDHVKSSE
jgi:hypothetical protein